LNVLTPVPGGVRIRIRVQPRASRSEVAGVVGEALKVRLIAPPVDGAANDALIRFLAESLHTPRSSVTLISGHTSRTKVVEIRGLSEAAVRSVLGLA
jgi:uncharacterized protein